MPRAQKFTINLPLKTAIWRSGKTQRELSITARIGEARFSKIVRGHELPTDDEKRAIARALRASVAVLFPSSDQAVA